MAKMKFKLNSSGVKQLLKSRELASALIGYADEVANRAGDGYEVYTGTNRLNVSVETATADAVQDNLDNNTLLKAVR